MIEAKLQGFIKVLAVVRLGGGRGREGEGEGGGGRGVGLCHEGGIGSCLALYKYT